MTLYEHNLQARLYGPAGAYGPGERLGSGSDTAALIQPQGKREPGVSLRNLAESAGVTPIRKFKD
jgi:hypothetical protein